MGKAFQAGAFRLDPSLTVKFPPRAPLRMGEKKRIMEPFR